MINIDLTGLKNELKSIAIYDISGRKVMDVAVSEARKYSVNRGNLTSGSYIVKVSLENGEANKKVILQ